MKWCLQEDGRPWLISLAHELLCKLLALSHTSAMMPTYPLVHSQSYGLSDLGLLPPELSAQSFSQASCHSNVKLTRTGSQEEFALRLEKGKTFNWGHEPLGKVLLLCSKFTCSNINLTETPRIVFLSSWMSFYSKVDPKLTVRQIYLLDSSLNSRIQMISYSLSWILSPVTFYVVSSVTA